MKHYASTKFWQCFDALPLKIQKHAKSNYSLLKKNPQHPSLHFKKIYHGRYRSVRIGLQYRAIGVPVSDDVQWFWIGTHSDYNKLLH